MEEDFVLCLLGVPPLCQGKCSISLTNLSETDDIHAPLLLSSCGLKAEIFIRCGTYANTRAPTSEDDELNSRPEGS